VIRNASPLLEAGGVAVECALDENLPLAVLPGATLRQALFGILAAAIRVAQAGHVRVEGTSQGSHIVLEIRPIAAQPPAGYSAQADESLEMARQLLELSGGYLEVIPGAERSPFTVRLLLRAVENAAVLVIDDNADALQLYERYLAGTSYHFVGSRDARQAMALAEKLKPTIIVLDVMLPGIDGWELLQRLREDPATQGIPVVVCTILPEAQLALALGAADFLRKPVSRADFLAALDRQIKAPSSKSSG